MCAWWSDVQNLNLFFYTLGFVLFISHFSNIFNLCFFLFVPFLLSFSLSFLFSPLLQFLLIKTKNYDNRRRDTKTARANCMFSTQLLLATVPGVAAAPPASVTVTANESFVPFGNFGWLWIQAQQNENGEGM